MTNDNTTRKKANAVFFSVIMVISMAAVGFAAAPAAAVSTSGDDVEITYTEITDEQSVPEGTEVEPVVDVEVTGGDGEIGDIRDAENIAFGTVEDDGSFNVIEEDSLGDAGIETLGPGDDPVTVEFVDNAPGAIGDLAPGAYDHQVALVNNDGEIVEDDGVDYASDELTLNIEEDDGDEPADPERPVTEADRIFETGEDYDGALVYAGQVLAFNAGEENANAEIQLRGEDEGLEGVEDVNENGYVIFDTAGEPDDEYFLRGDGFDENDSFEVIPQEMEFDFDEDSVNNAGSVSDVTVDVDIASDIRNSYVVTFTAEDGDGDAVEVDTLEDIFSDLDELDANEFLTENDELDRAAVHEARGDRAGYIVFDDAIHVFNAERDSPHTLNFDGVPADEYDFTAESFDSDAEDTDVIEVQETAEGDISFEEGFVPVDQGDEAEVTINFDGDADTAFFRVGDFDDVGYEADIGIENNGEDSVTLAFNTYAAGDDADSFRIVDADDSDAELIENSFDETGLTNILATGTYEMEIGLEDGDIDADESVDVGDLDIQDRSFTDELTMHTVSDDVFDGVESEEDIDEAIEDDLVQEQTENTFGDVIVHQFDSTGLQGIAAGADDLLAADGVTIEAEQTAETTRPNADPKVVDFGATEYAIIEGDETFYIAINTNDVEVEGDREAVDGDEFDVTLTIDDERLPTVSGDDEDVATGMFSVVDREGEFDEPIEVNPDEDQVVTGTTNAAPGNTLNVRVRSATGVSPGFVFTDSDIEVQPDGTFTADELDFSEASDGNEFTVRTRQSGFAEQAEADGIVVDADDPEGAFYEVSDLEPADAEVDQGDVIDEISATITNTGDEDGDQTVELRIDQDGENVLTVDQDVGLDAGDDTTVVFDDVETDGLEGDYEHGIYSDDDEAVGTLTVNVDDDAPDEDDDDDTDADDDDDTDADDDDTDADDDDADDADDVDDAEDDTPGFGAIVALVALIAAALLATRRRN